MNLLPPSLQHMDSKSLFGDVRNDVIAAVLEFVGTIVFLLIGLGGIQAAATSQASLSAASSSSGAQAVNTVASIDQLLYISASMGLALLVAVWLFYRVTGGVFNPAVSTALFLIGAIGPVRWALYCIAQLLGAIVASAILLGLLPGPLVVTPTPGQGVNDAQAVFIEMFLTSFLVFAVLMLAAEKHRSTAFAPIGIGLTLFASHMFGVLYTGAAMNTARAFGPSVVSGFSRSHWVYWVGPFLGSILATTLYALLKHVKYWHLNPDQDIDDPEQSPEDPIERAKTITSVRSDGNGNGDGNGVTRARTGSTAVEYSEKPRVRTTSQAARDLESGYAPPEPVYGPPTTRARAGSGAMSDREAWPTREREREREVGRGRKGSTEVRDREEAYGHGYREKGIVPAVVGSAAHV